jgi:hypothetical protein
LEYAFAHVRDDLHVAMPVHRKAAVRGYLVVVPDYEVPELCVRVVALAIDGEVVPGLKPVAICASQRDQSSQLQHSFFSRRIVLVVSPNAHDRKG